jgi:hypothetical protein
MNPTFGFIVLSSAVFFLLPYIVITPGTHARAGGGRGKMVSRWHTAMAMLKVIKKKFAYRRKVGNHGQT